jgi:pyridoxamine 5'-phosphate oxidase
MRSISKLVADLRQNYTQQQLGEELVDPDPIVQFDKWFSEAMECKVREPNAMTLATADSSGQPHARIVLLKGYDERGFVFFTNYQSLKGHDLEVNPKAALVFLWLQMERQVRITGSVEKTSIEESEAYFHSRPEGSRLGAVASPQSQPITKAELVQRQLQLEEQFTGKEIPRPEHWGGYRIIPQTIEFWQGRPNRLHDRIQYTREGEDWKIERLAP